MLAQRVLPALDYIIDQDQKVFLSRRRACCNIKRVMEVIELAEEEEIDGVIISIDFLKCFDRIEIPSLLKAMQYFGLGDSYHKWTRTIYTDPIACVINNGHFSQYFNVEWGVRQGGPNSAYFFLILVEILAIELRKNKDIQGFAINEIMWFLGQYADDIDLYLKGTHSAINTAYRVINKFQECSGFKINYDKTAIYKIGSLRKSNAKFYTKEQVSWLTTHINVLGVNISANENMFHLNYNEILNKMGAVFQSWQNRNLSLMGKVVICNTMVASLFIYKMTVLPKMPKKLITKINRILTEFIWNGKWAKIALDILQTHPEEGGLGLANFEFKDWSLKISWVQIINSDEYVKEFAYRKLCKIIRDYIWKCNINQRDVIKIFGKSFWTDVLC